MFYVVSGLILAGLIGNAYATHLRIGKADQDATAGMLRRGDLKDLASRYDSLAEALEFSQANAAKLRQDFEADVALKAKQIEGLQNWCRVLEKAYEGLATDLPKQIDHAFSLTLYRAAVAAKPSKD